MAEQQKGAGVLAQGIAVLVACLAVFGGLSYQFYDRGFDWMGLLCFAGIFVAFGLMVRSLRAFFGKYNGRLLFGVALVAVLGSYFGYLAKTGRYPMGIDLAGGTELVYVLNYEQSERNI